MHNKSHPEKEERDQTNPKAKATTYPCDENLRREIRALRDAANSKWSNNTIAAATRTNSSYISQYLNDDGNLVKNPSASLEPRLRIWLRDLNLRRRNLIGTISCPIADEIFEAIDFIYKTGGAGCIIGPAGVGKSRGAELAVKKLSHFDDSRAGEANEGVFASLIHVLEGKHTAHGLAAAIIAAGKAGRPSRGVSDSEHLFDALEGSTLPILIDDAHDLTNQAIRFLFRLREKTGVPIIMLGTAKLLNKLRRDEQWLRRAGMKWDLTLFDAKGELKDKVAQPLIDHHISSILGDVNGESKDLNKLCKLIVSHAGHFGSLHEQLFQASMLKKGKPDWTWCEAVKHAHKKLIREYDLN